MQSPKPRGNKMNGEITGEFNSNTTFVSAIGKPIFIINKEGCHVPEGVSVDEASQGVIDALDDHIKCIVKDLTIQRDELLYVLEDVDEFLNFAWRDIEMNNYSFYKLEDDIRKVQIQIAKVKGE